MTTEQRIVTENETFEIEIETMAYGGSGLGKHDNQVVFVPYTIPGEVLEAAITDARGRIAFGKGVRLLDASADRVLPQCQHFGPGRCGGCQWQHMTDAAQILIKQDVLADQLERVGGFNDVEVRPVIPSPQLWGYNHRMTFTFTEDGKLGLPGADGGVHPVEVCEVLHPDLLNLYAQLDLETGKLQSVELVRGDGSHMVILGAATDEAPELELDLPASINLLLPDNEPLNLAGDTHVIYTIAGRAFRVTAGSAFRANVTLVDSLVAEVLAALGKADSVLDLYAGVGLFGAFIAEQANYVTLVESYPPAATDADENTADFDHVDVIEGTVEEILEAAEDNYDAAVVNPPGSGLTTEAIDGLAALRLTTLVYVSSDAATFSRDAKRLRGHGFELAYVQPLDFAPQTYYTEIVGRFTRTLKRAQRSA